MPQVWHKLFQVVVPSFGHWTGAPGPWNVSFKYGFRGLIKAKYITIYKWPDVGSLHQSVPSEPFARPFEVPGSGKLVTRPSAYVSPTWQCKGWGTGEKEAVWRVFLEGSFPWLGDSCFVQSTVYILVAAGRPRKKAVTRACFAAGGRSPRYVDYTNSLWWMCILNLDFWFTFGMPGARREGKHPWVSGPQYIWCFGGWCTLLFCTSPVLVWF